MTHFDASELKEGEWLYFPKKPSKQGVFTGRLRTSGSQLFIQLQQANKKSWIRCEQLEKVQLNPTIEDKIESLEFAAPHELRQHLVFQKLCGRLAEVIYSMEATNTEFKAYQYKPVLKLLDSPAKGILVADEVGLGKTIEAGLIWTELRARFDMSRLLVVCPANLRKKWVHELEDRFQCDARECSGADDVLDSLKKGRKRHKGFSSVCSFQSLLPPKDEEEESTPKAQLHKLIEELSMEANPSIDLLVIDEAHYLRNPSTKANQAIRALLEICEHVVLLSATPIHLGSENLFSLLNILDGLYFHDLGVFNRMVSANEPIVKAIRSLPPGSSDISKYQEQLKLAIGQRQFRKDTRLHDVYELSREDRDWSNPKERMRLLEPLNKVNLFNQYIVRNRKRDVEEEKVIREVVDVYVEPSAKELEVYDKLIDGVHKYAERQSMNFPGFLLSMPERQFSSSIVGTLRRWDEIEVEEYEQLILQDLKSNAPSAIKKKIGPLTTFLSQEVFQNTQIDKYESGDSKVKKLLELLGGYFAENPKKKIILFSFFKTTLRYLQEVLEHDEYKSSVLSLSGDSDSSQRWEIIKRFQKDDGLKILLSSEVGAEGIDLQFCSAIINYDLPWNPMRVEQRIGRIDRIGQREETIKIYNFVVSGTIDEIIYEKLWKRISVFENVLGDVEMLLNELIRDLTKKIYSHKFTKQQKEEFVVQTQQALTQKLKDEEDLERNAGELVAFHDVITQRINNARTAGRWVSAKDVEFLFKDFFKTEYLGTEFKATSSRPGEYQIKLSQDASFDFRTYIQNNPVLQQAPTNFSHDRFGKFRFTNKFAPRTEGPGIEEVDQFHPIVRFAIQESRDNPKTKNPLSLGSLPFSEISGLLPDLEEVFPWLFYYVERWTFEILSTVERLNFVLVTPKGQCFDGIEVETLVSRVSETSEVLNRPDFDKEEDLKNALKSAQTYANQEYLRSQAEYTSEILYKAKYQKSAIENNTAERVRKFEEKVSRLRQEGKEGVARRQEGKIAKMKEKMREQMRMIETKLDNFESEIEEVCAGVILIT